jgi:DUF4097 and DUF4098 domain-containing protein YvlB
MLNRSSLYSPLAASLILAVVSLTTGCIHFGDLPGKAQKISSASYYVGPAGEVTLGAFNGRIEVKGVPGGDVRIETTILCNARTDEEAAEGLEFLHPEVEISEGHLTVQHPDPGTRTRRYCVQLDVQAPEGSTLFLRTSNGDIRVAGVHGDIIEARSSNGWLKVVDGGRKAVWLETSNGDVTAERLAGGLSIRTHNGAVTVDRCSGPVDAKTSNGRVDIFAPGGAPEDIRANTSNGKIRCTLPSTFAGEIDASTSNADVSCGLPVAGSVKSHHVFGRIGVGGPRVTLSTSNGPIEIRAADQEAPASPPPRSPRPPEGTRKV